MKQLENVCKIGDELALSYEDGSEMYFSLPMLRRACPCAQCQGEPDAMGRVLRPVVEHGPGAFELKRFEKVGGYGLQLFWGDGHGTGIFSMAYLQKLNDLQE
ncbi:gamma-butyrobetaine hydroxylase-like domain-containing protein [Luteolibacter algae]|uniref:Gamma-butyrobetaine hydroxylase-like domain-containing protein n=1 Tax=Luteolibacter algae TaxID=454151 RepID=A0ABW5D9N5_9BACT